MSHKLAPFRQVGPCFFHRLRGRNTQTDWILLALVPALVGVGGPWILPVGVLALSTFVCWTTGSCGLTVAIIRAAVRRVHTIAMD